MKQSKALIRTFKRMKDYIMSNQELIGQREYIKLAIQTAENSRDISKMQNEIIVVEKQMSDVMHQLWDVVTKSDLADMMSSFVDDEKNAPSGVDITLFSDNVGYNKLHSIEFNDFCKEYPSIHIELKRTGGIYHDRFIVLDYGTDDVRVFLCGASSKDAGARNTSIVEDFGIDKYKTMVQELLENSQLELKW